jgi:hypothetical protein
MKTGQATAEVFFFAFKALKASDREAFIGKVVSDPKLREDLIDAALIEVSKKVKGKSVSAKEYFSRNKKKGA